MYLTLCKIRDDIKTVLGDSIREYIIDDPNLVPKSSLPALSIAPTSTIINIVDNVRDEWTYNIDIILIIDASRELKKYKQEVVGTQYLIEKMEAKNSSGVLQANTILYIIRNTLKLGDNWNIGNVGSIDYSLRTRGSVPDQFVVKEARMSLTVSRLQNR